MLTHTFFIRRILKSIFLLCLAFVGAISQAQIAQQPLLSVASTAKPNLMFLLDNSGSMKFRFTPDGFVNTDTFAATVPRIDAYRSPQANRLWYNPAVRYAPRSNADGTLMPAATEASALSATIAWHDAPDTAARNNTANIGPNPTQIFYYENCVDGAVPPVLPCTRSLGGLYGTPVGTYSNTLTFSLCTQWDPLLPTICIAATATYSIPPPQLSATFVTVTYVAKAATRTDCTTFATRCSWAEERQNALNWHEYYSTRMEATKTAIGQAFLDSSFINRFRLGYGRMNATRTVGAGGDSPDPAGHIKRGVRPFVDDPNLAAGYRTERTDFYTWLYQQTSAFGTPSREMLEAAGQYFSDSSNTGPWSAQPIIGSTAAHLSCRRNTAMMFSDGAYSGTQASQVPNIDNGDFTGLANTTHVHPVTGLTFTYQVSPSARAGYVAYPDTTADTMADTAMRYWIQDLRPDLVDNVPPIKNLNPAFWQHLSFYTIGYGIRGSVSPADVDIYASNFLNGVATTLNWGTPPNPPPGQASIAQASLLVNDYIHSAYTGRGKAYSVVTPEEIRDAVSDVVLRSSSGTGSDAGVAVSGANSQGSLSAGGLKYVPSYSTGDSTGDIEAFALSSTGSVLTPGTPTWVASREIPAWNARNIVTHSSSGPVNLSTAFASLPLDVRTAMGTGADQAFVNYLRGQPGGVDSVSGRLFRQRAALFGTVINAPPALIRGELKLGYEASTVPGASSYASYLAGKRDTTNEGLLFSPSNDGMLHILNPKSGTETMAYIPRNALSKMRAFATDPYVHQYILDGPITEGDIYNPTTASWRQMVYGSGGRGGKYVYALSIPTATTLSGTYTVPNITGNNILWEIDSTQTGFSNLGHVLNDVTSGYLPNGRWVAIFGNGYYSSSGIASLFIVDALTGALIQEISTNVGTVANPNALTGVTLVRNAGRVVIGAYAGDTYGNVWKFDLRSTIVGGGQLAFTGGQALFSAGQTQPISGAPAWRQFGDGTLVVAATGRLVTIPDQTSTSVQTVYGIYDKTPFGGNSVSTFSVPVSTSTLQLQTVSTVVGTSSFLLAGNTSTAASFFRVSTNPVSYSTQGGWYLNLTVEAGLRNLSNVDNFNEAVLISSVVPPSPTGGETCPISTEVRSYSLFLDAVTGGNVDTGGRTGSGFDVNGDTVGDGFSVLRAFGFSRNSVVVTDRVGPATESLASAAGSTSGCSTASGTLIGTGVGSIGLVSGRCSSFTRTWQQLLSPPRIP
jgi:type IV pilus assembly protein PilY1